MSYKALEAETAPENYAVTVGGFAIEALRELGAKEYVNDIAELLKDKNLDTRKKAVVTLGEFASKEYTKDIIGLLDDKSINVRWAAEGVLKKWGYDIEKLKAENKK